MQRFRHPPPLRDVVWLAGLGTRGNGRLLWRSRLGGCTSGRSPSGSPEELRGATRPDRPARRCQQELQQARKPDRGVEEARAMDSHWGERFAVEVRLIPESGLFGDCLRVTRGRIQGGTVPTYPRLPLTSGEKPSAHAGAGMMKSVGHGQRRADSRPACPGSYMPA